MEQSRKEIILTIQEGIFTFKKLLPQRLLQEKKDMRVIESSSAKDRSVRKAIKIYDDFQNRKGNSKAQIIAEIACMKSLCHPNIIKLEEAIYSRLDQTISLITPLYSQGTLLDILKMQELNIDTVWKLFIEIGCAVRHLHKRHVVHGDIKPANVFISETGSAVLADFDQARSLGNRKHVDSWAGSRNFVGPEYQEGCTVDPYLMDAYALGTTLFAMYFFHSGPLKSNCDYEDLSAKFLDDAAQPKTYHLVLMMNRLVRRDPRRRRSVIKVLKDVQLPEMKALIDSL